MITALIDAFLMRAMHLAYKLSMLKVFWLAGNALIIGLKNTQVIQVMIKLSVSRVATLYFVTVSEDCYSCESSEVVFSQNTTSELELKKLMAEAMIILKGEQEHNH